MSNTKDKRTVFVQVAGLLEDFINGDGSPVAAHNAVDDLDALDVALISVDDSEMVRSARIALVCLEGGFDVSDQTLQKISFDLLAAAR